MNIVELLERARSRTGVKSDRALCRELRLTHQAYLNYRRGVGVPSDDTMLRLCAIAGVSDEEGLLLVNMWRSKGRATAIYRHLWQELRGEPSAHGSIKPKIRTRAEQIPA